MRKAFILGLLSISTFAVVPFAAAQETGLDGLHEQRREGGRICMVSHFHYGSSGNFPTRKAAEAQAIKDWAGFTAWEYGDPWGRYRLAVSKKMECSKSGTSWSCKVEARPCKPAGRRR